MQSIVRRFFDEFNANNAPEKWRESYYIPIIKDNLCGKSKILWIYNGKINDLGRIYVKMYPNLNNNS